MQALGDEIPRAALFRYAGEVGLLVGGAVEQHRRRPGAVGMLSGGGEGEDRAEGEHIGLRA
ncbi:hypothetical protein ACIBKX_00645 [Streptomyces sp. NPDC050658]|uniref:hypothetical protein n=1 Tax=unclassified Streptomyces TaxID=2593676 RepID=UPI003448A8AC